MNNTYADHLISQAKQSWDRGEPCPIHIITQMYAAGIDAAAIEDQYDANRDELEDTSITEDNLAGEEETHG